jgi:hypothetical protein
LSLGAFVFLHGIAKAYQWLLAPTQASPQAERAWGSFRLSGQDPLAVRASKKLRNDDLLVTALAGTVLRMPLDRIPLWRGDHVAVKQIVDDFARYVYLPRLSGTKVLLDAIGDGLSLLTWEQDTFAYADSYDEASHRYRGLRFGQRVTITDGGTGLLVKPEAARRQIVAETPKESPGSMAPAAGPGSSGPVPTDGSSTTTGSGLAPARPRRFHGTVALDPTRVGRDAGRVADEIVSHLVGLVGSHVEVTLEIQAEVADGVPDKVVRTVTENSRTLKFSDHGFEES